MLGIVYDGPPEAGKTTSVRALAQGFGREVYTPEEQRGRTVYFDWLEHTGGRFDGAPIRCQIVSVPGQDCFLERRRHLLGRADVVVFVGDTSRRAWSTTLARLRELCAWLEQREGPATGVVFQANRRDAPDAVPLETVKAEAASARVCVIESVALDGSGVREAFVFAVRLALDRVREEQRLGSLPALATAQHSSALLAELRTLEHAVERPLAAEPGRAAAPPTAVAAPSRAGGFDVPSGLVWPPVEGRILLREALPAPASLELGASRERPDLAPGYRASSPPAASFEELDEGRKALVGWARLHVSAASLLTRQRCILLAEDAAGAFRLWQIVQAEPSLRELFVDGCETMIARHAASQLVRASRLLGEAQLLCQASALPLACTLDSVGVSDAGSPVFVGDMPLSASDASVPTAAAQMAREVSALLRQRSSSERAELCRELELCRRREPGAQRRSELSELIDQLEPAQGVERPA